MVHRWYIDALAVDPDHWGEKIASHLLDEAEVVAAKQGYHILSLNVDQENPRAQRLYSHKLLVWLFHKQLFDMIAYF